MKKLVNWCFTNWFSISRAYQNSRRSWLWMGNWENFKTLLEIVRLIESCPIEQLNSSLNFFEVAKVIFYVASQLKGVPTVNFSFANVFRQKMCISFDKRSKRTTEIHKTIIYVTSKSCLPLYTAWKDWRNKYPGCLLHFYRTWRRLMHPEFNAFIRLTIQSLKTASKSKFLLYYNGFEDGAFFSKISRWSTEKFTNTV